MDYFFRRMLQGLRFGLATRRRNCG